MIDKDYDRTLPFLKKLFPDSEIDLERVFMTDPEFREIVLELEECMRRHNLILKETGKESSSYRDTIDELRQELQAYLRELNTKKPPKKKEE